MSLERRLFLRGRRTFSCLFLLAGLTSAGCNELAGIEPPTRRGDGGGGGGGGGGSTPGPACGDPDAKVDRLDLLLAIDNSRGMAEKQQILALSLPELVSHLVNPPCVDPDTLAPQSSPATPDEACPAGTEREFEPPRDIHIGVVSSSLGGHGSDACGTTAPADPSNDDMGHLLARKAPSDPAEVETYQGLKFLAWDPQQQLDPPGEANLGADTAADPDTTALLPSLAEMVGGVGEIGCGYESQLESWYRFLVDPEPRASLSLDLVGNVVLEGTDTVLLAQRRAFLRPDSMVMIVMLTDEDDCSIREEGQYYLAAKLKEGADVFHLPRARAVCDAAPNDPCCFPCGQSGPLTEDGTLLCAADPTCAGADGAVALHDGLSDNINLRCYNQKRRFGVDFLYPIDRYTTALTSCQIPDRSGQLVPNPLFTDLDPADEDATIRTPDLVVLAGIVGVPWQDIARPGPGGAPDLVSGEDGAGRPRGGFKSADELTALLPGEAYDTWDLILGDPSGYPGAGALPKDPLMIQSIDPRVGVNPVTGDDLVGPDKPLANPINGHEFSLPKRDDLQYACIFPLPGGAEKDCTMNDIPACECRDETNDNPLCAMNPATNQPTTQVRGKAHPGLRHLQVLRGLGPQGLVGSICPAQLTTPDAVDYAYRPAMRAITDRWRTRRQ